MKTRVSWFVAAKWSAAVLVSAVVGLLVQAADDQKADPSPAQPPAEVEILKQFEDAAPGMYETWLKERPESLKRMSLGEKKRCGGTGNYFRFLECRDEVPPGPPKINVRKTDSILTPYLGELVVPYRMTCDVRNAVPSAWSWSDKATEKVAGACVGKTYEECLAGGAKPAGKTVGSDCTGGPGFSFPHEGESRVYFRWSKGSWEFEKEEGTDVPRER